MYNCHEICQPNSCSKWIHFSIYFFGQDKSTGRESFLKNLHIDDSDCVAFNATEGESISMETIKVGKSLPRVTAKQLPIKLMA